MKQVAAFLFLGFLSVPPSLGQASQADSQTLQAILTELRAIHNDVRLNETSQILLTEMGMQQAAVTRAVQRRDDLRTKLSQLQANEKNITAQLSRFEDNSDSLNPTEKKNIAVMQENLKASLASFKSQEQDQSNALQEAESSVRREQDALDGIKGQLDNVIGSLQPAGGR